MSDTANPASLASSSDFDARLKRTDEDRWLATRYASPDGRRRLVAIYLFNQELQRTLHAKEAMLGKIRLQWWRETLCQISGVGPVRHHDLSEELGRVFTARPDLLAAANALIDGYDDILDDHLHAGGRRAGGDHEARHLAVESLLMKLVGLCLDAQAPADQLAKLAALGEARVALAAGLPDAQARWDSARAVARELPSVLWPAALHLTIPARADLSPLARRWRVFRAALLHSL